MSRNNLNEMSWFANKPQQFHFHLSLKEPVHFPMAINPPLFPIFYVLAPDRTVAQWWVQASMIGGPLYSKHMVPAPLFPTHKLSFRQVFCEKIVGRPLPNPGGQDPIFSWTHSFAPCISGIPKLDTILAKISVLPPIVNSLILVVPKNLYVGLIGMTKFFCWWFLSKGPFLLFRTVWCRLPSLSVLRKSTLI